MVEVPVEPRHVCILFRRFTKMGTDITRPYVDALEARGVPHLLVGGTIVPRSRGGRDAARGAGRDRVARGRAERVRHAARRPLRDRRRGAARVPGTRIRGTGSIRSTCPRICRRTSQPVGDALALLRTLHAGRNHRPAADTIGRLLEHTRAHVELRHASGRRARAGQRAAGRGARASVRGRRRHLVPRLRRRAARGGGPQRRRPKRPCSRRAATASA